MATDSTGTGELPLSSAEIPRSVGLTSADKTTLSTGRKSRGLPNDNGYCYRNAVLQCLISLPEFYRFCKRFCERQHRACKLGLEQCAPCALQYLTRTYLSDSDDYYLEVAAQTFHLALANTVPADHGIAKVLFGDTGGSTYMFLGYIMELFSPKTSAPTAGTAGAIVAASSRLPKIFVWENKRPFTLVQEVVWRCEDCGTAFSHEEAGDETSHFPRYPVIAEPWLDNKSISDYFDTDSHQKHVSPYTTDCAELPFFTKPSMAKHRIKLFQHSKNGSHKQ